MFRTSAQYFTRSGSACPGRRAGVTHRHQANKQGKLPQVETAPEINLRALKQRRINPAWTENPIDGVLLTSAATSSPRGPGERALLPLLTVMSVSPCQPNP